MSLNVVLLLATICLGVFADPECLNGPSVWYRGNQSTTNKGYTCQRWDVTSPHTPKYTPADGGHHNFCRNPDHDITGTWCYTTNSSKKWDYCNITKCPDDSLVIWTNVNRLNATTQLYSLPADPEIVRRSSSSSKISVDVFVASNPSANAEFWAVTSDYASKKVFFADYRTRYLGVYDQVKNKTTTYLEGMGHGIEMMAYDWENQNLYLSDSSLKWILVTDKTFQYYSPVYKSDPDPTYGLAVHARRRYLFFSSYKSRGSKIIRTDLAGKNKTILYQYPDVYDVTGLTVDYADEKIYWTDFTGHGSLIMSANFDGTNKTQKYYSGSSIFWGIASYNSLLYVTDVHRRIDHTGALYYHLWWIPKARNQKGRLNIGNYRLKGKPRGVTVMAAQTEQSLLDPVLPNACNSPPYCQQICIPRDNSTRQCLCSLGYAKQGDTQCVTKNVGDRYMLIADAGQGKVFRVSLDNSTSNYTVLEIAQQSKVTYMTNDAGGNFIFWSDKSQQTIFKTLNSGAVARQLVTGVHARFLAFEPLDENLFYIDDDTQYIAYADANTGDVTTIMKPANGTLIPSLRQLTLDLQEKKVYWTDTQSLNDNGQIWRMNYDGSSKELVFKSLNWPHGITIDQKNRTLYFTESKDSEIYAVPLSSLVNVTGLIPSTRKVYKLSGPKRRQGIITDVQVMNGMIYFNDRTTNYMEVIDPTVSNPGASPFGPREFYRIRSMVYHDTSYYLTYISRLGRPCATKGCSKNCVALTRGTAKCMCQDGFRYVTPSLCVDDGMETVDHPPTYGVTCPFSQTRTLPPCANSSLFSWAAPAWTDDNTAPSNLNLTSPPISSPARLGPGYHELSYTATDNGGNVGHCTFAFTVTKTQCRPRQQLGTNFIETVTICGDNGPEYNVTCFSPNEQVRYGAQTADFLTNRCFGSGEWMYPNLNGIQCVAVTTTTTTTTTAPTTTAPTTTTTTTPTTTTRRVTTSPATVVTASIGTTTKSTTTNKGQPTTAKSSTTPTTTSKTSTTAGVPVKGPQKSPSSPHQLSGGATAGIVIIAIVFVIVVVFLVIQYVRNGKRGVGMIIPVFWKPKEDTVNLQNDTDDGVHHYSVL